MRFFETIISGAALIAAVIAQSIEINDFPAEGVVAGQSYTITYSPADNTPTTFILRQGASTDLSTVETITTGATGGSFTWTPSASLPNEPDYALEIRRGDEVNYSAQFPLSGGSDEPAVSSAVSSAGASAISSVLASVSGGYSTSMPSSVAASASSVSKSLASQASSLSSVASSAAAHITTGTHASASATIVPSHGANSTISTATLSRSASSTGSSTTSSLPEVSEAAGNALIGSPLAALFGAAAAFAYLA